MYIYIRDDDIHTYSRTFRIMDKKKYGCLRLFRIRTLHEWTADERETRQEQERQFVQTKWRT